MRTIVTKAPTYDHYGYLRGYAEVRATLDEIEIDRFVFSASECERYHEPDGSTVIAYERASKSTWWCVCKIPPTVLFDDLALLTKIPLRGYFPRENTDRAIREFSEWQANHPNG